MGRKWRLKLHARACRLARREGVAKSSLEVYKEASVLRFINRPKPSDPVKKKRIVHRTLNQINLGYKQRMTLSALTAQCYHIRLLLPKSRKQWFANDTSLDPLRRNIWAFRILFSLCRKKTTPLSGKACGQTRRRDLGLFSRGSQGCYDDMQCCQQHQVWGRRSHLGLEILAIIDSYTSYFRLKLQTET